MRLFYLDATRENAEVRAGHEGTRGSVRDTDCEPMQIERTEAGGT